MPNATKLRAYMTLEAAGELSQSKLPGTLGRDPAFRALLGANILKKTPKGGGHIFRVVDAAAFQQFLNARFPGRHAPANATAAGNVHRYRNSKASRTKSAGVVLLRGAQHIVLNGQAFDLAAATRQFGCAACLQPRLEAARVCLVENLSSFLQAEKLLGDDWTFVHTYGRYGRETFAELLCKELLHFGDYDYTGLDEYLRLRERYPPARLYCPERVIDLWPLHATPTKEKDRLKRRVAAETKDADVIRIRELIRQTNTFLEQQALFITPTETP